MYHGEEKKSSMMAALRINKPRGREELRNARVRLRMQCAGGESEKFARALRREDRFSLLCLLVFSPLSHGSFLSLRDIYFSREAGLAGFGIGNGFAFWKQELRIESAREWIVKLH